MKSKEKLGHLVLRISLISMVILSIILSAIIWGSDSRFSHIEQTSSRGLTKEVGQKSLRDIYVPTQVFYYKGSHLYQVYDGQKNLPLEFDKLTSDLTRGRVSLVSKKSSTYRKLLKSDKYMQLTYPDQITMPLFLTSLNKRDNREFNRFFAPKNGGEYLYLGNDYNYKLYRLRTKGISYKKLYKNVQAAKTKYPVTLRRLKDGYSVSYEKAPSMQVYSYLTNEETDSYFVYRLLGTGSPSQRNSENAVTYYNGTYQRLISTKKTHRYEFIDYQQNKVPKLVSSRLMESLYYVRKIGLSEPDLRFFDADNKTFVYQNFVEEAPIFFPGNDNTKAQVVFNSNGMRLNFNSLDLQVPVPSNGWRKTLITTSDALDQLESRGYATTDINKIVIGYLVQRTKEKDNLVDLVPTYYVKINGQWRSFDDWMSSKPNISSRTIEEAQ